MLVLNKTAVISHEFSVNYFYLCSVPEMLNSGRAAILCMLAGFVHF